MHRGRHPTSCFLPGSPGRHEQHRVQPQLTVRHLARVQVGQVGRIEGAAENSYSHRRQDREPGAGPRRGGGGDISGRGPDPRIRRRAGRRGGPPPSRVPCPSAPPPHPPPPGPPSGRRRRSGRRARPSAVAARSSPSASRPRIRRS